VNPTLDPYGGVIARTDHDLTGPSLKVSYATPRILGLRAGASFTPDANAGGLDRDPVRDGAPDIENAAEFALNLSRRLPRSGVRLRAGAAYSQADAAQAALPGIYDTVKTWSAGGSVEFSALALGANTAIVIRDTQVISPASFVMSICHTCVVRPMCTGRVMPVTQPLVAPFRWLALMSRPTARWPSGQL